MYERLAILFVDAFYLYASLGVAFAIAFVTMAQPVRIRGRVSQIGDTLFLETEPTMVSPLS